MKTIILSTPEIQAVRDGRKIQIRRAIKPQPSAEHTQVSPLYFCPGENAHYVNFSDADDTLFTTRYPIYSPGDTLYVRETWRPTGISSNPYAYRADKEDTYLPSKKGDIIKIKYNYKPSSHMPREAARIFLRVTNVRAERLQDISEGDAKAEGVKKDSYFSDPTYTTGFCKLWESINAKRGYGWDVNPWVWVYEFERTEKRI